MVVSTLNSSSNHNNNSNSTNNNGTSTDILPPGPNPLAVAYEEFTKSTPYVTRTILTIQVISYIISWFVNPYYSLATIPKYIYENYEYYRLFVSSFVVNTSLISIIFAFFSFVPIGIRYERSMGSTAFGWLCFFFGTATTVAFYCFCLILYVMTDGNPAILLQTSAGIWNILFGIIALECIQSPRDTKRRFFVWEIPALYYPIVLVLFFTLLSGGGGSASRGSGSSTTSYFIALALGYGFGYGKFDYFKLSSAYVRKLEDTHLAPMIRRDGWIPGPAALGSGAWHYDSVDTNNGRQSTMLSGLPLFQSNNNRESSSALITNSEGSIATTWSTGGGGRVLGSTATGGNVAGITNSSSPSNNNNITNQRRSNADTRMARLLVFDKKTSRGDISINNDNQTG